MQTWKGYCQAALEVLLLGWGALPLVVFEPREPGLQFRGAHANVGGNREDSSTHGGGSTAVTGTGSRERRVVPYVTDHHRPEGVVCVCIGARHTRF